MQVEARGEVERRADASAVDVGDVERCSNKQFTLLMFVESVSRRFGLLQERMSMTSEIADLRTQNAQLRMELTQSIDQLAQAETQLKIYKKFARELQLSIIHTLYVYCNVLL